MSICGGCTRRSTQLGPGTFFAYLLPSLASRSHHLCRGVADILLGVACAVSGGAGKVAARGAALGPIAMWMSRATRICQHLVTAINACFRLMHNNASLSDYRRRYAC